VIDLDDLEPITPEQRELMLRMGLARRLRPYVYGDPEVIAERIAAQLVEDIESIGFVLVIAFDRTDPT
jgi:hypothetical protein